MSTAYRKAGGSCWFTGEVVTPSGAGGAWGGLRPPQNPALHPQNRHEPSRLLMPTQASSFILLRPSFIPPLSFLL